MTGCYIDTGDDVIALKSGMDFRGREFNRPTKNVLIQDSALINENLAIGSELRFFKDFYFRNRIIPRKLGFKISPWENF